MRLPRVRMTVRRMMIAVAVLAVIFGVAFELLGLQKRRNEELAHARVNRWQEAQFRENAARFRLCPVGHHRGESRSVCPTCWEAWIKSYPLRPDIVSSTEAIRGLERVAALWDTLARRHERIATCPWLSIEPVRPAIQKELIDLHNGRGPLVWEWDRSL